MVAECLEVRARLRVRRCRLGVLVLWSGVDNEGALGMGGGREGGRGEGDREVVGVAGCESLMGGECGSG